MNTTPVSPTSHEKILLKNKPGLAARSVSTIVLTRVIDDHRGLDGLLDTRHGPKEYRDLSVADQNLVRAIITTACRHRGEIEFALDQLLDRALPKNARHLVHTLHVAASQILFLDVPDSAAVDLAVSQLKQDSRSKRFANLGNAILRRLSKEKDTLFAALKSEEVAVLNMPQWLKKDIKKSYGRARLPQIAEQHMLEPVLDITVKQDPEYWAENLGGIPLFGNSIRVCAKGKLKNWPGYKEGQWWVQDAAAHLPAYLLKDIAGKQVADLCAAPGGKTAQLINTGAHVTAVEASKSRLGRLKENLQRLNLQAQLVQDDLFHWQPDTLFDAVLLDAPCSSTGTIRRHPDVQWTKTASVVEELAQLQIKMIRHAAGFLKPGGILVFSNCSINRTEGEDIFSQICKENQGLIADPIQPEELFGLQEVLTRQQTLRTLPCHLKNIHPPTDNDIDPARLTGLDGFFAARFKRAANAFVK